MFDDPSMPTHLQRAKGRAEAGLSARSGRTRLDHLAQSGSAKVFLPRSPGAPEVVFLNTAGGLTGGDAMRFEVTLGPGAEALATTQTAERAYRASAGAAPAAMSVRLSAGAGARLDWLPQETILYDGASLARETEATLSGDAEFLMCEAVVLGRAAMGETLHSLDFEDRRVVRRDGRPVLIDAVQVDGEVLRRRDAVAGLAGARAFGLLAFFSRGAEDATDGLRGLLPQPGVRAEVSGWDGRTIVRLLADDGWPLRVALARLIRHLRPDGAVPRVWQI